MTRDQLEDALRHWGRVYGERVDREPGPDEKAPAVHPIARAMEYGHRSVDRRQSVAYQRTIRAGEKSWSRDPILCVETRSSHSAAPIAPPRASMAERVQSAWLVLARRDPELANVLRIEYHVRGERQRGRADMAGLALGKYREMLAEGRGWMMGRMILAEAA